VPGPTGPTKVSPWVWAFRFLRWSTYLATLVTLILLLHKTPPPPVQTTPQAAASAEAKVQQVQQSVEQGQGATLRLNESELNSYLASHLNLAQSANTAEPPAAVAAAPAPVPGAVSGTDPVKTLTDSAGPGAPSAADIDQARSSVKDVKVQMEGDLVKAYVVFDVHGKDMTLVLAGHLGATNGYLDFQPISGQIGSLPIPQSTLVEAVKRMMDSPDNREKLKLPADVSDLHVVNGELVTTYH
jgi:hypothetical protein